MKLSDIASNARSIELTDVNTLPENVSGVITFSKDYKDLRHAFHSRAELKRLVEQFLMEWKHGPYSILDPLPRGTWVLGRGSKATIAFADYHTLYYIFPDGSVYGSIGSVLVDNFAGATQDDIFRVVLRLARESKWSAIETVYGEVKRQSLMTPKLEHLFNAVRKSSQAEI